MVSKDYLRIILLEIITLLNEHISGNHKGNMSSVQIVLTVTLLHISVQVYDVMCFVPLKMI